MTAITDIAVPALLFLMMTVVGLELLPEDFRRVRRRPAAVLIGTLGQLLLLPLFAAIIAWTLQPSPDVIAGLVLVAACPGGALSNYYSWLARADVALSVTLTAVATLLAAFTLPLVAGFGFRLLLDGHGNLNLPIGSTVAQLLLLLVVPVVLGMSARHHWPRWAANHNELLRAVSLIALVALLAFVAWDQAESLLRQASELLAVGVAFSLLSLAGGLALGAAIGLPTAGRFTFGVEHAARNLGIAVAVGSSLLGDTGVVVFAVALLLIQTPLLLGAALLQRRLVAENGGIATRQRA